MKRLAGCVLAAVIAIGLGACANTENAVVPKPTNPKQETPAQPTAPSDADQQAQIKQKYGIYPLPISEHDIKKYKVTNKELKEIPKARKLAASSQARMIRTRESQGNYATNSGNGYYGAYQMNKKLWKKYGGLQFAKSPDKAPSWAQDLVVYRAHEQQGWSPWAT